MIEVNHLTKKYGNHTAISDISFKIDKGCVYGFLGPNGAGKSTTMNIMTGCLAATYGTVIIDGHDIYYEAEQAKKLIGYLPEIPPLYPDRTPLEYLLFVAEAKQVPKKDIAEQINHAMDLTGINEVKHRLIKNLSKGYKQRVGFAQALIGNPEIIILDEPTVGLDPKQIIEIRDLIKELGKDHTVILSSHILSEVQAICEKVIIIAEGKLLAFDSAENLENHFVETTTINIKAEASEKEIEDILSKISDIISYTVKGNNNICSATIKTTSNKADNIKKDLFFAFSKAEKPLLETSTEKANLEDIFIELTTDSVSKEKEGEK